MSNTSLLIDVESIGLHGEGYALAYCSFDMRSGTIHKSGYMGCPSYMADGLPDDREWIEKHVDPFLPNPTHENPREVRKAFWELWLQHRVISTSLYVQCGWPVEANFLRECVNENPVANRFKGPFPLRDVADFMHAASEVDPNWFTQIHCGRMESEQPEHDPQADVRRSVRILRECMGVIWRANNG